MVTHPIDNRQKFADIINENKYQKVVEVGVRRGWFSEWLLKNTEATIYSVDCWLDGPENRETHKTIHESIDRLYPYGNRSIVIKAFSEQIVNDFKDETFGLIYIDALHSQAAKDICDWWPKLIKGGCMSGHDYNQNIWPKVYNAVNGFVEENKLKLHITKYNSNHELGDRYGEGDQGQLSWYFFKE